MNEDEIMENLLQVHFLVEDNKFNNYVTVLQTKISIGTRSLNAKKHGVQPHLKQIIALSSKVNNGMDALSWSINSNQNTR